jgi:formate dehydrogenase subunit gamma
MNNEAEKIRRCVANAVQKFAGEPGPLLEILHVVQNELGCVPPEAVPQLAEALNLSRAEVHGVISFYHDFRKHAPGQHIVKICRAEACQSVGGRASEDRAKERLNAGFHETSADGRYTLEPVYCLGNCACAPSAMIDGKLHGRVTPKRFDQLIDALEARR